MLHDFDPFLLQISGNIGIRWYGLSYLMGFICSYFLIVWLTSRQKAGLEPRQVMDFITYAAFGTLIGGRLGYCLFYDQELFMKFTSSFPYWGVLQVHKGGMASHGGMIGIIVACLWFARKYGVYSLYLFDLCAVAGPIGIFFGRIANFINGELMGRPAPESFPLAVRFPQDILSWPSQEVDRLNSLVPVVEPLGIAKESWLEWVNGYKFSKGSGDLIATLERIILEVQEGNGAVKEALKPLLTPRHPSQLYAAVGEGLFVFLVLFFLWRKPRKPGFIGAAFVMVYGAVRIIDEMFRLPDAHIGYQALDLTRGQWLSVVMFFCGLILMLLWGRTERLRVLGWQKEAVIKINRRK